MTSHENDWTDDVAFAHGQLWVEAGWTWRLGQVMLMRTEFDGGSVMTSALVTNAVNGRPLHAVHTDGRGWGVHGECVPDMRDPGTRGHAHEWVEDRVDDGPLHARLWPTGEFKVYSSDCVYGSGRTRSEALLESVEWA